MFSRQLLQLSTLWLTLVFAEKCDQRPREASANEQPSPNNGLYTMTVQNQGLDPEGLFMPDQRYVISLFSNKRPFRGFMITVEDPNVDNSNYEFESTSKVDVGTLKTIDNDLKGKYSERCINTIENVDNSKKERVEIHWLSPKNEPIANEVRIRAMVAENSEVWYVSPHLNVTLTKDKRKPTDSPPYEATEHCGLCSEARYEIIFQGQWSRLTHPQRFPDKLDDNAYSHMVGASHSFQFVLWQPNTDASLGLKLAAEKSDMTEMENQIIEAISSTKENSTRTLIRGQKNAHPNMFRPSHALFRVDQLHHLFSVVIAIRPSPDWFLGAHSFELCTPDGWLESFRLPLYPFDAGTMDGVSYESDAKMSSPTEAVARVALGSYNKESPFYQINLNDLKPFAHLQINRLDVYELNDEDCLETETTGGDKDEEEDAANIEDREEQEEPQTLESREVCGFSRWSGWSNCLPEGECGHGNQFRTRVRMNWNPNYAANKDTEERCIEDPDKVDYEFQECHVYCY